MKKITLLLLLSALFIGCVKKNEMLPTNTLDNGLVVNEEYRKEERSRGHGAFWYDNEKYDDLIIDGLRVSTSTEFS